jgi:hypothetical protein
VLLVDGAVLPARCRPPERSRAGGAVKIIKIDTNFWGKYRG